uniref:DNA-directed RNA polymerase III subunit RPC9 n=1 Tax=Heterorhabditis bacteriophora TaxID=37862 RepID=A0A1I7XUI9_HETBA
MEVINSRVTMLTNYEVLQLLREVKKDEDMKPKQERSKTLSTIVYEVSRYAFFSTLFETTKYLRTTPATVQTTESISRLIKDLASYKLTAAEIMQIINLRPSAPTEIQLIVEESEERIKTEEQLDALVNIITECLPSRPSSRATCVE